MRRRLVFATALAVLIAPAPASASTLRIDNGIVTFTANPGAANDVEFSGGPNVDVLILDADVVPTSNCDPTTEHTHYVCRGVARVVVDAGNGNDQINATPNAGPANVPVVVSGGDGNDTIIGGSVADTLEGGPGNDTLIGAAGGDTLNGGAGNDGIAGNADNDTLNGEDGDDNLDGDTGADVISGGAGIDDLTLDDVRPIVDITLDGVANDGAAGEGDNVLPDVEDVTATAAAAGTARIVGSDAGNILDVDGGVATIVGGAGSDALYGGPQDDTIDARDGYADRVFCDAGNDTALVDPLDTVSATCENAPVTVVAGGADDRPPTVAWTAPKAGLRFRGDVVTTLAVDASDDRGVAKVQFFDDDRLLCEDATAPYTCPYHARGADLGRNTLIATAVDGANQAGSAVRLVTVTRFRPTSLSLNVSPSRDRRAPYSFRVRGRLAGAGACSGTVTVTMKAGRRTVSSRRAKLSRTCRYALRARFGTKPASRLRVKARFGGNSTTLSRSSRNRTARLG